MRLNQFLALASPLSRRAADGAISQGLVKVNDQIAELGQQIDPDGDQITLSGKLVKITAAVTIILNKPVGYVTSRRGQGSRTIYDLLPYEYQGLKPAGRLDKASSGLLILSNDGELINRLIHPSQSKLKRYQISLDRPLTQSDLERLKSGVDLEEGSSQIKLTSQSGPNLTIELETGWNRQIRRTFAALGNQVKTLERVSIGEIRLDNLKPGQWRNLTNQETKWLNS